MFGGCTSPKLTAMASSKAEVGKYIDELKHPFKTGIAHLRSAILAADARISEHIKWNAPSFCYDGDDRVTFRLPPKGGFQLIFHRGAKVKDTKGFSFQDDSGLIQWAAIDRGIVTFSTPDALREAEPSLLALIKAWMKATAN